MEIPQIIIDLLIIGLITYFFFGIFLYVSQRKMLYHPSSQNFDDCKGFEDSEKVKLEDTRMYFKNVSDTLLVYYHGNAGSACDRSFIKERFESLDLSHLFVEYTGYSDDDKKPSKERLLKNVEDVKEFISEKDFDNVIVVGSSLGTSMASYHAKISRVDKLLLISPYVSTVEVGKDLYPLYPIGWLLKDNYKNFEWLQDYNNPLLVIHPGEDSVVAPKHGKKLYEKLNVEDKEFILLENVGHNDVFYHEEAWSNIREFLS